jgi:hypothetical protein
VDRDQAPGRAFRKITQERAGERHGERVVIHLERVTLPRGLSALAHRDPDGNLVIFVSAALDASRQRAAVVEAIRATRRGTWRAGLPPVGLALVLGIKTAFRRVASAVRARPMAWGAAATATAAGVATAGALVITAPPPQHPPAATGPATGPGAAAPLPQASRRPPAHPGRHGRSGHGAGTHVVSSGGSPSAGQPSAPGKPAPTSGGGGSAPSPAPSPQPSTAPAPTEPAPAPSPSPSPSPSPTGGTGVCVTLLVVKACLPPVTVKVKL